MTLSLKTGHFAGFAILLGVLLPVCYALTCTPETDNTCTKSRHVTGRCVSGVCECVAGFVADDFGCHKQFKPTISVNYPLKWSGESRPDGHLFVGCYPETYPDGSFRWYRNGTEVEGERSSQILALKPRALETQTFECAINAYGGLSEKSDTFSFTPEKENTPYTVKPVVSGMVTHAALNSTIHLSCDNNPATYSNSHYWHIDGQSLTPDRLSITVTFQMTAERFGKPVTCTFRDRWEALNIESDPVNTPSAPAEDIPGVVVKGTSRVYEKQQLSLSCDISDTFALAPTDNLNYTWIGPDGNVIPKAMSKKYTVYVTKNHAGTYACRAAYNDKNPKQSPNFNVIVDDALTAATVIETVPKKAVLGGYMAVICSVPGYDSSTLEFEWRRMTSGFRITPIAQYSDSMVQLNDIQSRDLAYLLMCQVKGGGVAYLMVFTPEPMSDKIKPSVMDTNSSSTGASFSLMCESDYATPGVTYRWYVDSVEQAGKTSKQFSIDAESKSLQIQCGMVFKSNSSGMSDTFTIPANGEIEAPVIEVKGQPEYFIRGLNYEMMCSSISHNASAVYSWTGPTTLPASRTVALTSIQSSANGQYTCSISFGDQSKQSPAVAISVTTTLRQPQVVVMGFHSVFTEGNSYTLVCANQMDTRTVEYPWMKGENMADVAYAWTKDGSSVGGNSRELRLDDVKSEDSGDYVCDITMGDLHANAAQPLSLRVRAPVPPVVTALDGARQFIAGGNYSLECEFVMVTQTIAYTWRKDGPVDLRSDESIYKLTNVTESDNGNYTCITTVDGITRQSLPLEVVVTENGMYCRSPSDCRGKGVDPTKCDGLQCSCEMGYKMDGKQCGPIGSACLLHSSLLLLVFAAILATWF